MSHFIQTNNITLHYLDYAGDAPPLLLMHGLTANAYSFAGLVDAGLPYRMISVDLRGRGRSDKPRSGYGMAEHAADIIGLLDGLGLEQVVLGGHSYGGLLTAYTAVHFPDRVTQCIIIDSGIMHPEVRELIKPSLDRLGRIVPSWDAYRTAMQNIPFWRGYWDDNVTQYYRADVEEQPDGTVKPRSRPDIIAEAVDKVLEEPLHELLGRVQQPTLVLHALGPYGPDGTPPVVPSEQMQETLDALPNAKYVLVPGNHMTMLFGDNAREMVAAIRAFVG